MSALLATVFLASLLGSLHCAGMCGPFAIIATNGTAGSTRVRTAAYHTGRLFVYGTLGLGAGFFGAELNSSGNSIGIPQLAATITGTLMTFWGLLALLQLLGLIKPSSHSFASLQKLTAKFHRVIATWNPSLRAFGIGFLTSFLPCGWLYAFVITASGLGHPLQGAMAMVVFWVGTLPALVAVGYAIRKWGGALSQRIPWVSASALIIVGLLTLTHRTFVSNAHDVMAQCSHTDDWFANATNAAKQTPACCAEKH